MIVNKCKKKTEKVQFWLETTDNFVDYYDSFFSHQFITRIKSFFRVIKLTIKKNAFDEKKKWKFLDFL